MIGLPFKNPPLAGQRVERVDVPRKEISSIQVVMLPRPFELVGQPAPPGVFQGMIRVGSKARAADACNPELLNLPG